MEDSCTTAASLVRRIAISALVLLLAIAVACLFGSRALSLSRVLRGGIDREILLALRLPRALMAALAGGALALTGVLFQALFRNALAEPYTLGVSSGASLGAVAAISFGWDSLAGFPGVSGAAFLGALLVLIAIWQVASRSGISSISLLLAGITMNSICAALILFLSSVATFLQSFAITRWLIGRLDSPTYATLLELACMLIPCVLVAWRLARSWNLLAVGEEWAGARGLPVQKLLITGCAIGSIISAAVTAYTGPIGFVGLIIPHALRLKLGADHRVLVPCSFLIGGAFLALSDVLSRVLLAPAEIPVGVITALIGGPMFIWILYSQQANYQA
jgi:iron complex transport system permease protein